MSRPLTFACASALLLAFAAPAFADPEQQQVVHLGDLDLYDDEGADVAIRRIENASENVCGAWIGPMPLQDGAQIRECTAETMDYAISDVNNAVVSARFRGYTPEVIIEEDSADPYADDGKPKY